MDVILIVLAVFFVIEIVALIFKPKEKREAEVADELYEQYLQKPRVIKAADEFVDMFLKAVNELDRSFRVKDLVCQLDIRAWLENECCSKIEANASRPCFDHSYLISFIAENLIPLKTEAEMYALVRAIATLATKRIREVLKTDICGSSYTLEIQEELEYDKSYKRKSITVKFDYRARNILYQPPQSF